LPNLKGRVPLHVGGGYVQGQSGGQESHTLNISEMPAHTHVPVAVSTAPDQGNPAGGTWAAIAGAYSNAAPDTTMAAANVSPDGGSQPHQNLSPYLVLNFCIALQGVFPSQN